MTDISTAPGTAQGAMIPRRVSWGAIFAGTVVAVALMILFTTFGIAIGAGIVDPQYDQNPTSGLGIGSGIYLIVTQLIALGAGGYVAARLAGIPRPVTSVLHGASVWAVATIFLAWAAVMGTGAMFSAASSVMSGTASAASSVGGAVVPDDFSLPNPSQIADSISLDALPDEIQTSLREEGITEQNIRQETTAAFREVFSEEEQQAALERGRQTLGDIVQSPGDVGEEISAYFDGLVGGPDAIISDTDRQQALGVLQDRLGISPDEAEGIVQSVQDNVQETVDEARAAVEEARTSAIEAAQAATSALSTTALLLSIASVLGLAAAAGGAFAGTPNSIVGDRRDDHPRTVV